jgi:hypothetical protein
MDLFQLRDKVEADFVTEIIKSQIKQNKWSDCAVLISVGKLQDQFDCKSILERLAEDKKISLAKSLCDYSKDL